MAEGNPLASVPPWVWAAMILGGGGTLGTLQLGGGVAPGVEPPQELSTCQDAEERAKDALQAWRGIVESYGLILQQLNECQQEG